MIQKDIKTSAVFIDDNSPFKLLLISLIYAVFVIYPNITIFFWERSFLDEEKHAAHLLFFMFRYLFISGLIWILLRQNAIKGISPIRKRLIRSFLITIAAYLIYVVFSRLLSPKHEWYSGLLLFQFFVVFIFCGLLGYVSQLYYEQRKKEQEIEQLKIENLQSRYDALTSQIHPHFFFNSLNGLTSLIRKKNEKDSLAYVNKMSDVFRYILQSKNKGLITLEEELGFVKALGYMMEVRFASKLEFDIRVQEEMMHLKIPVLSLLPLIDNVVVHNTMDSEHKMKITIRLNEQNELAVSNPVYPKLDAPDTNGTGLKNLDNRFSLLLNKPIRIKNDGTAFTVFLPLKKENNENTDR